MPYNIFLTASFEKSGHFVLRCKSPLQNITVITLPQAELGQIVQAINN